MGKRNTNRRSESAKGRTAGAVDFAELDEALVEINKPPEGSFTAKEYATHLGIHRTNVQLRIKKLIKDGVIECIGRFGMPLAKRYTLKEKK